MMEKHVFNLFKIENTNELQCNYYLLEVHNLPDAEERQSELLHQLAGMVASQTVQPVTTLKKRGQPFLATTADPESISKEWQLQPHLVKLQSLSGEYSLDYSSVDNEQIDLACNFLRYSIRTGLGKIHELWNDTPSTFYRRYSKSNGSTNIDVLEGFNYYVHFISGKGFYIAIYSTLKYVDKDTLFDKLSRGENLKDYKFKHFLYKTGHNWYRIQFMGLTGKPINEQEFFHSKDEQNYIVYDYTLKKSRKPIPDYIENLNPNSPAILYRYPNKNEKYYGAAALCYKTYKPDDHDDRNLHSRSILESYKRLQRSKEIVGRYFQNIGFGANVKIEISSEPYNKSVSRFAIPDLCFGNSEVLHVARDKSDNGINIKDIGSERKKRVLDSEIEISSDIPLQQQYIFIPKSLNRDIADLFKDEFINQMERLLGKKYIIKTVIYDNTNATNLKRQVDSIHHAIENNGIDRGRALMIIPDDAVSDLHDYLKRELYDNIHFQCVQSLSIMVFFDEGGGGHYSISKGKKGNFISYIQYTALGMLLVNKISPFYLQETLSEEIHIGIDVLNGIAGFTFLYNGGRNYYFQQGRSRQPEKLSTEQMYKILYENLRDHLRHLNCRPEKIVIYRDGRTYYDEIKGILTAIKKLKQDDYIPKDVVTCVVEIHKTSSGTLRIFLERNGRIFNPRIGDYFSDLPDNQGIVCTTGWPFKINGTANPLLVKVLYGSIPIEDILYRVFAMSLLAWSAPDRPLRLPIVSHLCDMYLRPIASESNFISALYGEIEDELTEELEY